MTSTVPTPSGATDGDSFTTQEGMERGSSETMTPIRFSNAEAEDLGLEFDPIRFRRCGNRCIFCFVDQNPPGVRPSLRVKDEDFRLSFLYGNYVALTRVTRADLDRIVGQRLSPLYVSVHAADPDVRRFLFGLKQDDGLFEKLEFLAGRGIVIHAQIVLCPGINDGEVLVRTLGRLAAFHPALRSTAVVPVGLTRHRKGLPDLVPVDTAGVSKTLREVSRLQRGYVKKFGEPFVYLADEFYLLAGKPVPRAGHYRDFWQKDNGVGMVRAFLDEFEEDRRQFPKSLPEKNRFVLATGVLAGPILERSVVPRLNRIRNVKAEVKVVPNRFFGESVTVSGLLIAGDIARAVEKDQGDFTLLVPANALNAEGRFLDDATAESLGRRIRRPVRVLESFETFQELR